MAGRWSVALSALILTAWAASALDRQDRQALMDSLRYLPPNIRSYYLDKAGFDMWPKAQSRLESTGLRLVGRWGAGPSVRVTGRDSIVYLSRGSEVVVINCADTANPRVLTTIQSPGLVARSILVGNRLYISSGYIETFDISDPANPVKLGSLFARAPAIDVVDTLVYTLYRDSFKVFNFADPANPAMLGACRDSGYDLSVCNGYAYLGDRWGLYVLDVTDPSNPHRIALWGSNVISVKARGNVCCATLADINDNLTFYVLDARQPGSITPLGSLADQGGYDMYLSDSLAFLSGYYTGSGYEFKILSIGDSAHPRLIGQASTLGDNNGVWANMTGRLAFVADRTEGLQVFDISSPANPNHDTTLLAAGASLDIAVHGDLAAVANQSAGLKLISVANPANPVELGSIDTTYSRPDCDAVELADSFAFMGWQPNPYLRTILVTDPTHPEKVGACEGMQNDAQDMKLRDSLLYTVSMGRFYVVNVARPREPVLVGSCVLPGDASDLCVVDTVAYASRYIVSVAHPGSPVMLGSIPGSPGGAIAVRDSFAFVPAQYDSLVIVNVARPSSAFRVASLVLSGGHIWNAGAALVGDTLLYVGGDIMHVVNVTDASHPCEVASWRPPYDIRRVTFSMPYVYAACFYAGVCVLEAVAAGLTEPPRGSIPTGRLGIAPNPTSASVLVRWGPTEPRFRRWQLCDAAGRVRQSGKGGNDEKNLGVDLTLLETGVYFLEVQLGSSSVSAKVIRR
jgi:hypothetical protein